MAGKKNKKQQSRDQLRKGVLLNNFGYIKETIANWKVECNQFLDSDDKDSCVDLFYGMFSYRQRVCEKTILQTTDSKIREEARELLLLLRLCNRCMTDILNEAHMNKNIPIII